MTDTPIERKYIAPLLRSPSGGAAQLKKLTHKHLSLMDDMLANPRATVKELAAAYGHTEQWVTTVTNSDLFRGLLAERKRLIGERIEEELTDRALKIARKGLDAMDDAMEDEEVSVSQKHTFTRTALEITGHLGGKKGPQLVVNNNTLNENVVASPDTLSALEAARQRIRQRAAQGDVFMPPCKDVN